MNRTPWLLGCMTAALVAGCHHNNDTGAASVAPKDSAQAQTSAGRARSDSAYGTQDTAAVKIRMNDSTKTDTSSTSRNPSSTGAGTSDSMSMPHDSTGAKGTASAADSTSNQTKSGVTDTKTGKSTLGPGATKTSPDQGQPVTAKGDTLSGADSTSKH